jgi:hypothetical protein
MESVIFGLFCLLGVPLGIGVWIGWLRWGRRQHSAAVSPDDRARWLVAQTEQEPLRSVLTAEQRDEIRTLYAPRTGRPDPELWAPPNMESAEATGIAQPGDSSAEQRPIITSAPPQHTRAPSPMARPAHNVRRPARDPLDPAALLLYAGAFLIAAAGVVYSAYNWADLVAWQKLAMLAALTIAFAVVGWLLLDNVRLKQAGETFIAISAMLIPANAIAAWSVVQDRQASTGLIVLVGAAITSLVYGAYSLRPGGAVYANGAPLLGWLAIGAIPAALGFFWGWGAPLVILGVGVGRIFGQRLPDTLAHLRQPLASTGLVAAGVALLTSQARFVDESGWLTPATFGATTASLVVFAMRSQRPIWGIGATLAGIATIFSGLFVLEVDTPWVWTVCLSVLACALLALGESGPAWMRRPTVRLAVQIEAVLVALIAIAATAEEGWWCLSAITVFIGLTAAIAYLRQWRWVLLLTGVAIVLWAGALAMVIAPDDDWPTRVTVLYTAGWSGLLAGLGWLLDRWSRRTGRHPWGVPLWTISGLVAISTNLVPLADDSPVPGDRIWMLLAGINLGFGLLALVASKTVPSPGQLAAGGFGVVAAACIALSPDVSLPDRLPIALLTLVLVATLLLGWDRWGPTTSRRWLSFLVVGVAGLLVLLAMAYLALGYLTTTIGLEWHDVPGVRWTWVFYSLLFGAIAAGTGLLTWQIHLPTPHAISRSNLLSILVSVSTAFLLLTTLLVARMISDDSRVLVVTALVLSWAVFGATTMARREIGLGLARDWQRAGMTVAVVTVGMVMLRSWATDSDDRGLLAVSLVSLAGMLATAAWFGRNRWLGMLASAVAMVALLINISTREPGNVLAYSLPLGVYLLALGTVSRKDAHVRDALLGAGAGVLLLPVLWLAQDEGSPGYLGWAAAIALGLFLGGIGLRLRVPIAAGIIGMSLIVLRLLLDAVLALQSWVSLLIVGLVLLGAGTAALVWKDALRERLERIQRGWHDLG